MVTECGHAAKLGQYGRQVHRRHLEDCTQFLAEQCAEGGAAERLDVDIESTATRERHFQQRHDEPAVGAIVIGEQITRVVQELHGGEESREIRRSFEIGRDLPQAVTHLRAHRAAQALLTACQIDEQQHTFGLAFELWCERQPHIDHRREGGDDHAERRSRGVFVGSVAPRGAHRQRILADRNADPERLAQDAGGVDGGIEDRILTRMACGRHPVCREHHVREFEHARGGKIGEGLADRDPRRRCAIQ